MVGGVAKENPDVEAGGTEEKEGANENPDDEEGVVEEGALPSEVAEAVDVGGGPNPRNVVGGAGIAVGFGGGAGVVEDFGL